MIEAIEASGKLKKDKAMHSLTDIFPDIPRSEKDLAIAKLKEILTWIEELPLSKLPYVEMGFDALDTQLIQKLQEHNEYIQTYYNPIELRVQTVERIADANVYQECFPFWFGPYY